MPGSALERLVARGPQLRARLLRWYARHRRRLPWRGTRDPYRVWLSEVMLQQTRVVAAIPYYRAFLRAFPTVRALASATQQQVLRVWAGLGYYARARHLLRAARQIVRRGDFPTSAREWRTLPGVGPYTAAAVASIAFGENVVAVDGNVVRVGVRLLGLAGTPRDPTVRRTVQQAFQALLPTGRAGEFNQALMDLGATLCLPEAPRCPACPLREFCSARARGLAHRLPLGTRSPAKPRRLFVAALARDARGSVLLLRRPPVGLWGGLWTPPYVEAPSWEQARAALRRVLGVSLRRDGLVTSFQHAFTHFHATFTVYGVRLQGPPRTGRFLDPHGSDLPMPAPVRRLLSDLARQQRE